MANDYYIPGMPQNLQGLLYTPNQDQATTKRLRGEFAGNPGMQQKLAVDDRYHQGKGMMQESPVAALAALAGSVPYDAAKMAYFSGPKPVKEALGKFTERLFPGEGFNDRTTSRPSVDQYKGLVHGMAEGAYGKLRGGIESANGIQLPDAVIDRLRQFTERMNYQPTAGTWRMPSQSKVEDELGNKKEVWPTSGEVRKGMGNLAKQAAFAHASDPVGTSLKALSHIMQTVLPETDTRQEFKPWDRSPPGMTMQQAIAPGMKPLTPLTPERKRAQEAQISQMMAGWPEPTLQGFPKPR